MFRYIGFGRGRPDRVPIFPEEPNKNDFRRFQEVCTATNLLFFQASKKGDMIYRDAWDRGTTQVNIERVADREARKFQRIVERFPHEWPMHEQAAYVLRAFSGLQLYPDANHRTGLVLAAVHLLHHRHRLTASPQDAAEFVHNVRDPKSAYNARRTVDRIRERDGSFEYLAQFFMANIRRLSPVRWWWRYHIRSMHALEDGRVMTLIPTESEVDEAARKR